MTLLDARAIGAIILFSPLGACLHQLGVSRPVVLSTTDAMFYCDADRNAWAIATVRVESPEAVRILASSRGVGVNYPVGTVHADDNLPRLLQAQSPWRMRGHTEGGATLPLTWPLVDLVVPPGGAIDVAVALLGVGQGSLLVPSELTVIFGPELGGLRSRMAARYGRGQAEESAATFSVQSQSCGP